MSKIPTEVKLSSIKSYYDPSLLLSPKYFRWSVVAKLFSLDFKEIYKFPEDYCFDYKRIPCVNRIGLHYARLYSEEIHGVKFTFIK